MRTVTFVNQCKSITGADFAQGLAALQEQNDRDFAPITGLACKVVEGVAALPTDQVPPPGWTVYVLANTDQADALGYHTMLAGVPVGFVFAETDRLAGIDWVTTGSHELCELLGNPFAEDFSLTTDKHGRPMGVAREYSDGTQSATYPRQGRPVSDFVVPEWFRRGPGDTFDFLGKLHTPLTLLPGGYIPVTYDLVSWVQRFGERAPLSARCPNHYSRAGRILARNKQPTTAM